MGLIIPLLIRGLLSVFFLLLGIFGQGAQKFISLSTLLINSLNNQLKLLRSKGSSDSQSTFSSCSDIVILFFLFVENNGIVDLCFYFQRGKVGFPLLRVVQNGQTM